MQKTLARDVVLTGAGLHSGVPTRLVVRPAPADHGVVFLRTDVAASVGRISATWDHVVPSRLCTLVANPAGSTVSTIEHLMAALAGCAIHNALIEIDGPEVPMMDGRAAAFVALVDSTEIVALTAPRRFIKVLKPIRIDQGASFAELLPFDGRRFEIDIAFDSALIGQQSFAIDLSPLNFRRDLARARTFGFLKDVEYFWSRGLALGSSLDNTIVLADDRVLNPEGLRFADEFVRHKALDAVGDLALAGAPILGAYRSFRGGHRLNARVVEALLADPQAWTLISEVVEPRRQPAGAEVPVRLSAAAFGPDKS